MSSTHRKGARSPWGDLQAGAELLPDAVTTGAVLSLTVVSFEVGPHQGDTRTRVALALLPLVFPGHPAHCTREADPSVPPCAWVCMATYANVPGHHLNSSNFQLMQQQFLRCGKNFSLILNLGAGSQVFWWVWS